MVDLTQLLDALPGLVWTARADGHADYLNKRWLDYTGLTLDQAVGAGWHIVIHPKDLDHVLARWRAILEAGEASEVYGRLRRWDGEYRRFMFSAAPIKDDVGNVVEWCGINTDIEDWVTAEESQALRHLTEAQRLSLTGSFTADIWADDHKWSAELYRIFEIVAGTEVSFQSVRSRIHHEDAAEFDESFQRALEQKSDYDHFFRIVTAGGELKHLHSVAQFIEGVGGRPIYIGAIRDVTEAKIAEQALKESREELERTVEQLTIAQEISATGSWTADPIADHHSWSKEMYRIFDFDPASPPSLSRVRDVIHPDDEALLETIIERAIAGNEIDYIFRIVTREGNVKHLRVLGLLSGQIEGRPILTGAIQDVTKIKGVEGALKQRTEELQRTLEQLTIAQEISSTGSFTSDPIADHHIWSEEMYRIFDLDPATPLSLGRIRERIHPDDVILRDRMVERASAGEDYDYVMRIITRDGHVKHLRVLGRVTGHVEGRPILTGAIQDITTIKAVEEALNRARSDLARVARVTTLSAVTASIAHEVNQPLAGIITNANTCLRMLAVDPPNLDGARATAQRTIRDGNRASDVIQRLRALFSSKESELGPLDLNDTAREVIALCATDLERNHVKLRTDFADHLPSIRGDRVQLQQVILNLLLNGSEAMSAVKGRARELVIATKLDDLSQVILSVRDSGVGITPEQRERLFDAFYTTKEKGMGIGLSISRSIIDRHEGRLQAVSNDGPGATFFFSIPVDAESPRHPNPAEAMQSRAATNEDGPREDRE